MSQCAARGGNNYKIVNFNQVNYFVLNHKKQWSKTQEQVTQGRMIESPGGLFIQVHVP